MTEAEQEKVRAAARMYFGRQERTEHPLGSFDKSGRWYPDDSEHCACCTLIREPSRAYPHSLNKHCRLVEHVAALFGVNPTDVCRIVKETAASMELEARLDRASGL
jgi:hypothetical protein